MNASVWIFAFPNYKSVHVAVGIGVSVSVGCVVVVGGFVASGSATFDCGFGG